MKIATKAVELKSTTNKRDFVEREQRRVEILREAKLRSLRRIVSIQKQINNFNDEHKRLNDEINSCKAANQLLEACLQGLYNDKQLMNEFSRTVNGGEEQEEDELELVEGEGDNEE